MLTATAPRRTDVRPAADPLAAVARCPVHPDAGPLVPTPDGPACPSCERVMADLGGVLDLLPPDGDYPADFRERETAQWDEQADRYDDGRTRDAIYMAAVAAAADALAPRPGETVLDAGTGTGLTFRRLMRPGVRGVALDLSAASLRYCRRVGPAALYVRGDLARLPFATGTFDRTLCGNSLQQLPGLDLRRRCVRDLARVTKPGGRVVVTVQNFSRTKKRAGWLKESDRSNGPSGAIHYVYRYEPDELREQLSADLEVESLCSAGMPLPYKWKLSAASRLAERVLRRVPTLAGEGHMLVAVCRNPG